MPILMLLTFLIVQFALYYLGNQVVSSTAREAARIVRTGGTQAQAQATAEQYAKTIGNGVLTQVDVKMENPTQPQSVRVRVTGQPLYLVPVSWLKTVSAVSEGPLETFRPDTGG